MVKWLLALLLALAVPAVALPDPPPPPAGVATGRFVLPDRPPWAGEVFPLRLVWHVDWDVYRYLDGDLAWSADPLVTEGWTRAPPGTPRPQGDRTVADIGFTTRAIALAPGTITMQPARQPMQIVTGSYETSGVTIADIGPVVARSRGATPKIRSLPPSPPDFSGAVGDFALTSSVDAASVAVGKPIVWTVTVSGTGNWMAFAGVPSRPLPRAFDAGGTATPPSAAPPASLFDRTVAEAMTIVPRRPGNFSLGPVVMTVFDPVAGRYRTLAAAAVAVRVMPGAAPPPRDPASAAPGPDTTGLPLALAGVGHARAPLPRTAWAVVLALPLVTLTLLWLGLATRRALRTDPEHAARCADARLRRTVVDLAAGPVAATQRGLVRDWQRDAAIRLGIDHAAPTPGRVTAADWARLWDEADRHLYGIETGLPTDWPARASRAIGALSPPARFDMRRIFTPANLYPVVALLCLVLAALPGPLAATGPRQPQAIAPLDWIGHYNRGRAAAAAKDWPLATAHAGIAWVQAPRSAETTALWRLAAREAGVVGRAGGGLPVPGDMRAALAGVLPAFGWQMVTIAAALAIIGGYGGIVLVRFGHAPQRVRRLAVTVAAVGTLGGAVGWASVAGYGLAAAPDAAIAWRQLPLRALPVDTPGADVMAVLPAGTVGHRGATFLGWSRLTLGDGRSGWVRRGELMPLWEAQR